MAAWVVGSVTGAVWAQEPDIPESRAIATADGRPGLIATYRGGDRKVLCVVATPNFGLRPGESIHPGVPADFTVEWKGRLMVLDAGKYWFLRGGARLWLAGQIVGEEGVELNAGFHAFRMAYRREEPEARLQLRWRSEHFALEPVPSRAFSHVVPPVREERQELLRALERERGRDLVEELGCLNCHGAGGAELVSRRGPTLAEVGGRLRGAWVRRWLRDPRGVRPWATMPALLVGDEVEHVAAYLETLHGVSGRTPAAALATLHDVAKGRELFRTVGCEACHNEKGLGLSGLGKKTTLAALSDYLLEPERVHPEGRMPRMFLRPREARQLAAYLLAGTTGGESGTDQLESGDAKKGENLIRERGCRACHELDPTAPPPNGSRSGGKDSPLASGLPLGLMRPDRGCLASEPPTGLPRYRLTLGEKAAVREFLWSYQRLPDMAPAPVHTATRRVRQLRCSACHEWRSEGPDVALLERVPPLSEVGVKLRPDWLQGVLVKGERVRPELLLRMPHYATAQVAPLVRGLGAIDGVDPRVNGESVSAGSVEQQRAGVDRLGTSVEKRGMSCVACHDLGELRPIADEKGPQMLGLTARLRYDWFRRWMLDPARIVSGTSMPTFFSGSEREGADRTIAELWSALAMGKAMPRPEGAGELAFDGGNELVPVAVDEAVVQRFPLPGATAAAIAVGLPKQGKLAPISYCFDAAKCQLVYAWQGGFLDLRGSLQKKMAYPKLLGVTYYRVLEFPWRTSSEGDAVVKYRFRGYRMRGGYPEMRYTVDGMMVSERVLPLRLANGHLHEFHMEEVRGELWFALMIEGKVRLSSTVGEFSEGRLRVPEGKAVRFDVRVEREEAGR